MFIIDVILCGLGIHDREVKMSFKTGFYSVVCKRCGKVLEQGHGRGK